MVPVLRKPKSLVEPLVKTAAVLGIIEGLAWTALSLAAILLYFFEVNINSSATSLTGEIYNLYFNGAGKGSRILGPKEFNYVMYVYLVLHLSWSVASSVMLWVPLRGKTGKIYDRTVGSWTVITVLVCLEDAIVQILLGYDYSKLKGLASEIGLIGTGIIMTLAAHGYVLWVINVIFAVIIGKHWHRIYNKGVVNHPVVDAFSSGPRPWSDSFVDGPSGVDNKGFTSDDDKKSTFGSKSPIKFFEDIDAPSNPEVRNVKNKSHNKVSDMSLPHVSLKKETETEDRNRDHRVARLEFANSSPFLRPSPVYGRPPGQRDPPLNGVPPVIPVPDYTPPGSPSFMRPLRPMANSSFLY